MHLTLTTCGETETWIGRAESPHSPRIPELTEWHRIRSGLTPGRPAGVGQEWQWEVPLRAVEMIIRGLKDRRGECMRAYAADPHRVGDLQDGHLIHYVIEDLKVQVSEAHPDS